MRIMAVDLGLARTGLAISDEGERLAAPIGTVAERDSARLLERVAQQAQQHGAGMIVVGHPKNMDGTCGESAQRAEAFADALSERTGLEVALWDERMTTMAAIGYLNSSDVRGKKRKNVIDTVAATVILDGFLESRRLRG